VTAWVRVAFATAGVCVGSLLAWTSISPVAAVLVGCALASLLLVLVVGGAFAIRMGIDHRRIARQTAALPQRRMTARRP
jgi:hypothetical protein